MIYLQKNWELIICSVYELSYLCLICFQSCSFPFLFYHGIFHYFYLAQVSKNPFHFKFIFYRTGDFSGLIMDDIWNYWELWVQEFLKLAVSGFCLFAPGPFFCLFVINKVVYLSSYSSNTTSIYILVTYLYLFSNGASAILLAG